jgi:hypothetical protein
MDEFIFLEDEAAVRLHLGQCRAPVETPYNRAWEILEAADIRMGRAIDIVAYHPARLEPGFTKPPSQALADSHARAWPEHRVEERLRDDRKARLAALAAVEDSNLVKAARKLSDVARDSASLRDYAKAVAARIATEDSVWAVAYGRAMPRKWRVE